MRLKMVRGAGLGALLVVGLLTSACSSSPAGSKQSSVLMPQVLAAARQATSVHMTGSVRQGSQVITLDVSFTKNSMAGTVAVNGANVELLALHGNSYIKVTAAFLKAAKAPSSVCSLMCGKYVELPAASSSQITGDLSMQLLMKDIFNNKNMSSANATGCVFSPATANGQSVLQCRQGGYTVDVAAHGKPYLVYFSGPHAEHMAFTDWNAVTQPTAPPASQLVNLSKLG